MLIRFNTSVAGANFAYRAKQEADVPERLAREFLRARLAEPVEPDADAPLPGIRRRRRGARTAETTEAAAGLELR